MSWERFKKHYLNINELDFALDVSRIDFGDDFLAFHLEQGLLSFFFTAFYSVMLPGDQLRCQLPEVQPEVAIGSALLKVPFRRRSAPLEGRPLGAKRPFRRAYFRREAPL